MATGGEQYKRRVGHEIARSKKSDSAFGLRSQHGDWRGRAEQRMTSIELRALQGQKRWRTSWARRRDPLGLPRFDAIDERLRRFGAAGLTTAGQYRAWGRVYLEAAAGVASTSRRCTSGTPSCGSRSSRTGRERDERARRRRSDEGARCTRCSSALARVREEGGGLEMERERAEEEERMLEARARRVERKALRDSRLAQSAFHSRRGCRRASASSGKSTRRGGARRRGGDDARAAAPAGGAGGGATRAGGGGAGAEGGGAQRRRRRRGARPTGSVHSAAARRAGGGGAAARAISRSQRQAEEDRGWHAGGAAGEGDGGGAGGGGGADDQELEQSRRRRSTEGHGGARGGGLGGGVGGQATFAAVGVDGGGYSYASAAPPKEKGARFAAMEEAGTHSEQQLLEAAFDAMLDPEWEGEADPPADVLKVVHEDSD